MPLNAAQGPTFSTKLEVVRLDVLVTAGGNPVRGLTVDDFDVSDNGSDRPSISRASSRSR